MAWYRDFDYFPPSRPRAARGGIKAQTQRGAFGQSWWAKRWIGVLESFDIGSRLNRGRSYARSGQVLSIDIEPGVVKATVQGSRPDPYRVTIRLRPLDEGAAGKLAVVLSQSPALVAQLLAGQMPQDIEQAFTEAGLALFPARGADLQTQCSCPDWSNPCKHVAAVYYLLGEEFDRDPFLLLRLRGIDRTRLMELLDSGAEADAATQRVPASKRPASRRKAAEPAAAGEPATARTEPLAAEPERFWRAPELPADFWGEVRLPPVDAALPRRLGSFPFWRGEPRFLDALLPIYQRAAYRGLEAVAGEVTGEGDDAGGAAGGAALNGTTKDATASRARQNFSGSTSSKGSKTAAGRAYSS